MNGLSELTIAISFQSGETTNNQLRLSLEVLEFSLFSNCVIGSNL